MSILTLGIEINVMKAVLVVMTDSKCLEPVLVLVSILVCVLVVAVEGWIIFLTNIHEEAQEEDLLDVCSEYGQVKNFNMNFDRRTGFIKVFIFIVITVVL